MHPSGDEIETSKVIRSIGFFSSIQVFDGFFQSPAYANQVLKFKMFKKATLFKDIDNQDSRSLVAVHFRFRDYKKWSIFGKQGVILPDNYYRNSIKYILEKVSLPIFIIISDNIDEVPKHLFTAHRHIFYKGDHFANDFRLMSLCDHAIISCSTFSWWAAHLIQNQSKVIVAPKFWIGFKSYTWHPPEIKHPTFTYIDPIGVARQ
jgi:hypothetical protein